MDVTKLHVYDGDVTKCNVSEVGMDISAESRRAVLAWCREKADDLQRIIDEIMLDNQG